MSRLFSSAVFKEMATRGRSALFSRLVKEAHVLEMSSTPERVRDVFESAFNLLRSGECRDEYIYKAALTHKILLGKHSLRTACMMNEFRVGDCKADIAILNGTATVYEIKSERDTLKRLEKQIETYKKVFANVYVIAGENHVDTVLLSVSSDVGVLKLSKRHQIKMMRQAEDRPDRICPLTVFEAIRSDEAKLILGLLGLPVPRVPNTQLRWEMKRCFEALPPAEVHGAMVQTLKRTRNLRPMADLVGSLPSSLQAMALSVPVKKAGHEKLIKAVNTDLRVAMGWA